MRRTRTTIAVPAAVTALALFAGAGAVAPAAPGSDAGPDGEAGPPGDLPPQVPEFVGSLLDGIGQFVRPLLSGLVGAVTVGASNAAAIVLGPNGA